VDSNVQFLDQDDEDDPNTELYMSLPFACGNAFAISVLDCIMSTAYFNDNALTLIRTLITGGTTPELEQILAEGGGIAPGGNSSDNFQSRNRPRISQISLFDGEFKNFGENRFYGELFVHCLFEHNMLCWGVYRFKDSEITGTKAIRPSSKRYVICNPDADFRLLPTDLVYVLQQFDPSPVKRTPTKPKTTPAHPAANKVTVERDCSARETSKYVHSDKYMSKPMEQRF
jgi:potassium large conductance calcium-activated channel subfamily M alpha protein 1